MMTERAVKNLKKDIVELQKLAVEGRKADLKRENVTIGVMMGLAGNIPVPHDAKRFNVIQEMTGIFQNNQLCRSEGMRYGILPEHSLVIPVFLDSAEHEQLGLVNKGPSGKMEPNAIRLKEIFPNSISAILQSRRPPRPLLGRKDAPSVEAPGKASGVRNLVVRFGTEEEVSLARAEYTVHVAEEQGYGRKLSVPLFSFPAEYPWWYGQWLDKIQVTGVTAASMAHAVRVVMQPIEDQLGMGFVEPTPDAAKMGNTYTVYLHAYGMTNALEVILLLRGRSMVAFGRHPSLRWCSYCGVAGHDRESCGLPVIMIRSWEKLNTRTIKAFTDVTAAVDGFMGAARTGNAYNKKFAFFVYKRDYNTLLNATKVFAASDRLGQFSAVPRIFYGRPNVCAACGMLEDEADAAKVKWHQAGDGACKKHEYVPPQGGRTAVPPPKRAIKYIQYTA
jgi:hypothetical protein